MPYTDIISFSKCHMYKVLMFLNSGFVERYAFLKTDRYQWTRWNKAKVCDKLLIQLSAIDGKFGAMYIIFGESSYQLMPAVQDTSFIRQEIWNHGYKKYCVCFTSKFPIPLTLSQIWNQRF